MAIRALSSNIVPANPLVVTVPAETRRGDVMLWWTVGDSSRTNSTGPIPTGFTAVNALNFGTTIDGCGFRLAVRTATSAEPATYQSAANNQICGIAVLSGIRLAGLKTSERAVNLALPSPWNLSGSGLMLREVSDVLWFGASDITSSSSAVTNGAPPGYTLVAQYHNTWYHMAIAMKNNVLPGSTGAIIGTGTATGRASGSAVRVLAFPRTAGNTRRSQLLTTWPLPRYTSASINITARLLFSE